MPLQNYSGKSIEEDKLTDDDLKRHRVGGRLVTRKEILRSKKCLYYFRLQLWLLLIRP